MRLDRDAVSDLTARALVGALFALLSVNVLNNFIRTGRITGLLLLVSESLVVVLTIVRRRTKVVDRSFTGTVVTLLSLVGPPLVRTSAAPGLVNDATSAAMLAIGSILVIGAKLTLGRSFGIVPANRGVVVRGPYAVVRHPIYTGYLISHLAFLLAYPLWWNITILCIADSALIVRALLEERVLSRDARYQDYCARVGWHLVPGLF